MKKYKLTTNLPLKIIAFVFAAFLWLIVANVANPVNENQLIQTSKLRSERDVINTRWGSLYGFR